MRSNCLKVSISLYALNCLKQIITYSVEIYLKSPNIINYIANRRFLICVKTPLFPSTNSTSSFQYQLLMPHGLLCLQSFSWGSPLTFSQRRRAHWVLQLVGSILAFIGSVLMSAQKTINFNSLHGKFGKHTCQ